LPVVVGVTCGVMMAMLVGSYWAIMLLAARATARHARQ
jgi:hypothetical protein